jgi:hypothetical protein
MSRKRLKNVPILHDELKEKRTVSLTCTAWNAIKISANQQGVSASECIELWARSIVSDPDLPG